MIWSMTGSHSVNDEPPLRRDHSRLGDIETDDIAAEVARLIELGAKVVARLER
jgi:hypothetical protein